MSFFSLSNDDICSLLKNHQTFFVDFIDKFSFEKGKMAEKRLKHNNSVEEMEFDFSNDIIKENYLLKNTNELFWASTRKQNLLIMQFLKKW